MMSATSQELVQTPTAPDATAIAMPPQRRIVHAATASSVASRQWSSSHTPPSNQTPAAVGGHCVPAGVPNVRGDPFDGSSA